MCNTYLLVQNINILKRMKHQMKKKYSIKQCIRSLIVLKYYVTNEVPITAKIENCAMSVVLVFCVVSFFSIEYEILFIFLETYDRSINANEHLYNL